MSEKEFNEIFANNLKNYLSEHNMSQNELARALDVSPTSVNNWCRGIKTPRMDKIDKICDLFHIERSDLINEPKEQEAEIVTIAAHHDGVDWTQEELDEIEEFKRYVLSKRKDNK